MKKGFTLIELITSIALTSIILLSVFAITSFASDLLKKHQNQEKTFDEVYLIDKYLSNYIDESQKAEINNDELVLDQMDYISYDTSTKRLNYNSSLIIETEYIINIEFIQNENLIMVKLWITETEHLSLNYYKA